MARAGLKVLGLGKYGTFVNSFHLDVNLNRSSIKIAEMKCLSYLIKRVCVPAYDKKIGLERLCGCGGGGRKLK